MPFTPPPSPSRKAGTGTTGRINKPSAVQKTGAAKPATNIAKPLAKPSSVKKSVVSAAKPPKPIAGKPMRKMSGPMKRTF